MPTEVASLLVRKRAEEASAKAQNSLNLICIAACLTNLVLVFACPDLAVAVQLLAQY